jgi:quercetin dioxygenase-like cupin family protein
MFNNQRVTLPNFCKFCSIYGYSYGNSNIIVDGKNYQLEKGQYFSLGVIDSVTINAVDKLFLIVRLGYIVPNTIGWVEETGRLSYIDGCSDSLLVYPARLGDASLNLLYFPPGIDQTFHRHPSIRLGCVISGHGFSEVGEANSVELTNLSNGDSFGLIAQERHRFKTTESSMTVIAFHPDGDWGPTDHNHSMLNRTYQIK